MAGAMAIFARSSLASTTVYLQTDTAGPTEGNRFVAMVDGELHRPPVATLALGAGSAGNHFTTLEVNTGESFDFYAIFGRTSDGGVYVSFSDPSVAQGYSFESVFPGFNETELANQLLNNGPLVDSFASQLSSMSAVTKSIGQSASAMRFSDGAPFGTVLASFSPIPEPGSAMVAGIIASAALMRRSRRSP
jgi:hypothetical protein